MSSGNYAGKAGFNESGAGGRIFRCPAAWLETAITIGPNGELGHPAHDPQPCQVCGQPTASRDRDGRPRHPRIIPVAE